MTHSILTHRGGATALFFAAALFTSAVAVAAAVDFTRMMAAQENLQAALDAATLQAAQSREKEERNLLVLVEKSLDANEQATDLTSMTVSDLDLDADENLSVSVKAEMTTAILGLIGIDKIKLNVSSRVVRGYPGTVEVAMVLDNTYSMSESIPTSTPGITVTRMAALKDAAKALVQELNRGNEGKKVSISVVPYADYVNVGVTTLPRTWLTVPAPSPVPGSCSPKLDCSKSTRIAKTCTRVVDGVTESYDCSYWSPACTPTSQNSCSAAQESKFRGCVGSRTSGTLRLSDEQPAVAYPGLKGTSQACLSQITTLTTDFTKVNAAIDAMVFQNGSYKPLTYLPAGLVWGLNVLSSTEPYTDAKDYDPKNVDPRKVMVFMTDGANTLKFNKSTGTHDKLSTTASTAAKEKADSDNDTRSLCTTIKGRNIEVFTVALGVTDPVALDLVKSCATDAAHAFAVSDKAELVKKFREIAEFLRAIRLAR